jgi:hypothetical protein
MTVEVLSPPVLAGAGDGTWTGCLSGTFTVPGDWTIVNGGWNVAGNFGNNTALGYMVNTNAACGVATDQEVVAVWSVATPGGAGNSGYRYCGPATRTSGTLLGNHFGYSIEVGIVSGTVNNICNGFTLNFELEKWNNGVNTALATSFNLAGPTLTQGLTFRLTTVNSGSNAIIKFFLNEVLIYNVIDPAPLPAGRMGMSSTRSCGGITPANSAWQYIKGRNL